MGLIVNHYLRTRTPYYRMPITAFCVMLQAGFNNPWSVILSTMEMTSQYSKLKWNQELRFHCKVLNILTSFLLSTRIAERRFLTGLPRGYFFWGEGTAIHTQATIKPCWQPLHATESHVRLKHRLIQNIVPVWKTLLTKKREYHF